MGVGVPTTFLLLGSLLFNGFSFTELGGLSSSDDEVSKKSLEEFFPLAVADLTLFGFFADEWIGSSDEVSENSENDDPFFLDKSYNNEEVMKIFQHCEQIFHIA